MHLDKQNSSANIPSQSADDNIIALLSGETSLAALCDITPQQLENLYAQGYRAWDEGDLETATDCFAFVAQLNPTERHYIFAFACALQHQGEYGHALKLFNHALRMQESDAFALFHIARCLQATGETEQAREALSASISCCFDGTNSAFDYTTLREQAEVQLYTLNS